MEKKPNNKTINAMSSCTDNLSELLTVVIYSLSVNHPSYHINFYLFHTDIGDGKMTLLTDYCHTLPNVTFYSVKITGRSLDLYGQLVDTKNSSTADAARYLWFEAYKYLPKDMDRVLYLDSFDTLVVGDISEFYFQDFDDTFLSCCDEINQYSRSPNLTLGPVKEHYKKTKDLAAVKRASFGLLNSGSIVLNLEKFRRSAYPLKHYVKIWKWTQSLGILPFGDQGLFSLVYGSNFKKTRMDFNYRWFAGDGNRDAAIILHYTGYAPKPHLYLFTEQQEAAITAKCNAADQNSVFIKGIVRLRPWYFHYNTIWWQYCEKTPIYQSFSERARQAAVGLEEKLFAVVADIPNGIYRVLNKRNLAWDIAESSCDNGAQLICCPKSRNRSQRVKFTRNPDSSYTLTMMHSGKVIEVRNSALHDGASLAQWDDDSAFDCKRWIIISTEDGYYKFKNKKSEKVVSIADMKAAEDEIAMHQWAWLNSDGQVFRLERCETDATSKIPGLKMDELGDQCTGCGLCANVCPTHCVTMRPDDDGFLFPVVDSKKCTKCDMCNRKCPALKEQVFECEYFDRQEKYAFMAHDDIRMTSASGGVFSVLASAFLNQGDSISGAGYTDDFRGVKHYVTNRRDGLFNLLSTKYMQSDMGQVYREIKAVLNRGEKVLFSGCPCQCAAIRSFFDNHKNLYLLDLICHGVPSPAVWEKYLDETIQEPSEGNPKILYVNHRSKMRAWSTNYTLLITLDNGNAVIKNSDDNYLRAFLNNYSLRKACYQCRYANMRRQGDLTIGDFWNISKHRSDLNDGKGTSIIFVNTKRGRELISLLVGGHKVLEKMNFNYSQMNLRQPSNYLPYKRETFFRSIKERSLAESLQRADSAPVYEVGLVGCIHNNNLGGLLTNYAAYCTVKDLGYSVAIIPDFSRKTALGPVRKSRIDFYRKHNVTMTILRPYDQIGQLNGKIKNYVVMSDQLWNVPLFEDVQRKVTKGEYKVDLYFLSFAKEGKKIAFGTSFGGTKQPPPAYCDMLRKFDSIAVREESGVDICKQIGINAKLICDPVFTQTKVFYKSLVEGYEYMGPESPFVMGYFCAGFDPKVFAEKLQIKNVVNISAIHLHFQDFLMFVEKCEYLVCASFHGVCFALIYNKPFVYVASRGDSNTRLETLLEIFGLMDRYVLPEHIQNLDMNILRPIDWDSVNQKLSELNDDARAWLKDAIDK